MSSLYHEITPILFELLLYKGIFPIKRKSNLITKFDKETLIMAISFHCYLLSTYVSVHVPGYYHIAINKEGQKKSLPSLQSYSSSGTDVCV